TGSYPSGHASFGWAIALVLAEINPARQVALLRRGHEFGVSRVVCGAHWQSDVQAGQLMGAAIVAALHANGEFIRALSAAKNEFATLKVK
ncbi:phosphatase PAP2 family protein, partial [Pseudomonas viridiflava]|uniref:phosphatase PAP2 family protein n=1 Tax=Pseudomonas viridiflava TaxID=33069 RepID=UPI000F077683